MYLGNERRNRVVALGLAAVLLAGVVLALLATVAAAATVTEGMAATPVPAATAAPTPGHPAGHDDPVDPAELTVAGGAGHAGRLLGLVAGVGLLLGCAVMVVHEQRRRGIEAREPIS
ncbi:MAG: hypothetical protein ABI083_18830 [Lapillicoccus sp.]